VIYAESQVIIPPNIATGRYSGEKVEEILSKQTLVMFFKEKDHC
jgi:hypothetical protein